MFFKIFLILVLANNIRCSLVMDSKRQYGIKISEYCPKMEYCPEGTHTMCLYYDPEHEMGPMCRNYTKLTMTTTLANKLLDVCNAARSKIARGKEKGKDDKPLPRGYGIFRLRWDSELATFAQVMANQCLLRHDFCRATKNFPDPGQTIGLVRFVAPNFTPIGTSVNLLGDGITNEKLLHTVLQASKTWYTEKKFVTPDMLTKYPDWAKNANNLRGRLYLEMLSGSSTHIGCGISAYTEYVYTPSATNSKAALNFNSIQVICNFSSRTRTGQPVFNTVPPKDGSCGCPPGSEEDDDCLCNPVEEKESATSTVKNDNCPKGLNCAPTVVILPIFTTEDAPPEKLITREKLANTSIDQVLKHANSIDSFEELFYDGIPEKRKNFHNPRKHVKFAVSSTALNMDGQKERPTLHNIKNTTIRTRHFDRKTDNPNAFNHEEPQSLHVEKLARKHMQSHGMRPSIFAKTPKFELPGKHNNFGSIKRDVVPRKDFSAGKKLVSKYLYEKKTVILPKTFSNNFQSIIPGLNDINSTEISHANNDLQSYLHPIQQIKKNVRLGDVHFNDILTTEAILNSAEQKIINQKKHLNDLYPPHDIDGPEVNIVTENNDKKFMALLDTLEQEVKHIELHENDKQIFDAKIKKIYGTVVGKPSITLSITEKPITELTRSETNSLRHLKKDANKERYLKQSNKRYKSGKLNLTTKPKPPGITAGELEYERNAVEQTRDQIGHDDEIDFGEKYPKQDSNDIGTDIDHFVIKPMLTDENIQVDFDRRDALIKDSSDILRDDFGKSFMLQKKRLDLDYDINKTPNNEFDDMIMDDSNKKYRLKNKKLQGNYNRRETLGIRPNKNNDRRISGNQKNPFEISPYRYKNENMGRKIHKNENFARNVINNNKKPRHRSNSLDYKFQRKKYYDNDPYEDPLSAERRKYYQDKLDSMERKLRATRQRNQRKNTERPRQMRTMLNSARSENQMSSLYASGRSRYLHGY